MYRYVKKISSSRSHFFRTWGLGLTKATGIQPVVLERQKDVLIEITQKSLAVRHIKLDVDSISGE